MTNEKHQKAFLQVVEAIKAPIVLPTALSARERIAKKVEMWQARQAAGAQCAAILKPVETLEEAKHRYDALKSMGIIAKGSVLQGARQAFGALGTDVLGSEDLQAFGGLRPNEANLAALRVATDEASAAAEIAVEIAASKVEGAKAQSVSAAPKASRKATAQAN